MALEDESQQPWEHSPTHPQPPHILPTKAIAFVGSMCGGCSCHSAWHAVTPPVTIVLPLDAKLQDLGMHMTAVAAEEYLGSQLMPQNVESVYENVYFGISQAQRTCELAYPQSCNQPCVSCVCM